MAWFNKKEERAIEDPAEQVDEVLLQALLGRQTVTKEEALSIPSVKSCINFISSAVSMLPIKLYEEKDGRAEEITGDLRLSLLNDDTGDTLDAVQFWKALVADYFLGKGGYAYINKNLNKYTSLHYVDESKIAIHKNEDPIFKSYKLNVYGKEYWPYEFIKLLRNTKDGASGVSITDENNLALSVAYHSLVYEQTLVKKGGNKKGFIKAEKKLSEGAITALKDAWTRLYSNNSDNVVILNEGLAFQEASNTSVEMQLNENKLTNSGEIAKIFNMPVNLIKGTANNQEYSNAFKLAVMPVLRTIECALNKEFLLENEKNSFYYAFDTKEMLKGDIRERFEAYKMALDSNFLQIDEVRFMEDLPALGLTWIKLGLDTVLYDVTTKTVYTPNTNETTKIDGLKGGENNENESGDKS